MSINYITLNPWNQTSSLPRLATPDVSWNGRIEKDNGYTKFQWNPGDIQKNAHDSHSHTFDELFYTVNRQNFRAEQFKKVNDKPVLMSLGDSFTYGIGVRDAETWPSILADKLDMVNWNLASGGASNQDIYLIFQQMISHGYIPDVLCIMWSFKERSIVSRNIISPVVEEDIMTLSNQAIHNYSKSIKNTIEARLGPLRLDEHSDNINNNITNQSSDLDASLTKAGLIQSMQTDKDYTDFFIVRSAIINICKAHRIKVKETFLDHTLQKFALAYIVPVEGWKTGPHPVNAYSFGNGDLARDGNHFGPKTLEAIADYYQSTI